MADEDEEVPEISGSITIDPKSNEEKKSVSNQDPAEPTVPSQGIVDDRARQDNAESRIYAERAYNIVFIWIVFLFAIILMQFFMKKLGYGLEREEFIAVVGSLTASMFGFWYLVGRHLFPVQGSRK